ncbi:MAG: HRDC domain-containing protein [Planctomycetota bacterium]
MTEARKRGPRRRHSDTEAHADHGPVEPLEAIEGASADPPVWVEDASGFEACIAELSEAGAFAFDTEFIGEHTYYPRICLVQAATAERIWLIDPLVVTDLRPFWQLVAAPSVTKIVHAGLQDLEPVHRLLDKPPASVFDTQIAAGFCGIRYPVSLAQLATDTIGASIGRGLKFSQWDRRPLTDKQKRYAADDVRYLPRLYAWAIQELDQRERRSWADEEFQRFADPGIYRTDPTERKLKGGGASKLRLRSRAALDRLLIYRETLAEELDRSPRELIPDQALLEAARDRLTTTDQIASYRPIPKAVRKSYAEQIASVIREVIDGPKPEARQKPRRPDEHESEAIEAAWKRVGGWCDEHEIALTLATSRKSVSDAALRILRSKEPRDPRLTVGWRAATVLDVIRDAVEPFRVGEGASDS